MRTDTERIDALQRLTNQKSFTGKVLLRLSRTGRGWRLHETEIDGAVASVRQVIDIFLDKEKEKKQDDR